MYHRKSSLRSTSKWAIEKQHHTAFDGIDGSNRLSGTTGPQYLHNLDLARLT